jgi:hypothetical protein
MDSILFELINSPKQLKEFKSFILFLLPIYLESDKGRESIEKLYAMFQDGRDLSIEEKVEHLIHAFQKKPIDEIRKTLLQVVPMNQKGSSRRTLKRRMRGGQVPEIIALLIIVFMLLWARHHYLQHLEQERRSEQEHERRRGRMFIGQALQGAGRLLFGGNSQPGIVADRVGAATSMLLLPMAEQRFGAVSRVVGNVGRFVEDNEDLVGIGRAAFDLIGLLRESNAPVARSTVAAALPNASAVALPAASAVALPAASAVALPAASAAVPVTTANAPRRSVKNLAKIFNKKKN